MQQGLNSLFGPEGRFMHTPSQLEQAATSVPPLESHVSIDVVVSEGFSIFVYMM